MNPKQPGTTQLEMVLDRMRRGPATAFELELSCGASQAHTRLKELRDLGYRFESEWVEVSSQFGNKRVKRHTLVKDIGALPQAA